MLSGSPTWSGLGHALLILGALWWAWASYAWLTNTVDPGLGAVSAAMLVAMAAMFVAALAVPDAFGSHGVLFGVAFLIVIVMHLTLYALSARRDPDLLAAILRLAPSALLGAALIIVAGFVEGGLKPILWLAALAVVYAVPLVRGIERLACSTSALRRASRADRDHRDRRIADCHRAWRESQRTQRRGDRRRRPRVRGHDLVLVGLLRLLHDPRPPAADRPKRHGARRPRTRCLHLPALSDGGRNRPLRVCDEDRARGRRR